MKVVTLGSPSEALAYRTWGSILDARVARCLLVMVPCRIQTGLFMNGVVPCGAYENIQACMVRMNCVWTRGLYKLSCLLYYVGLVLGTHVTRCLIINVPHRILWLSSPMMSCHVVLGDIMPMMLCRVVIMLSLGEIMSWVTTLDTKIVVK